MKSQRAIDRQFAALTRPHPPRTSFIVGKALGGGIVVLVGALITWGIVGAAVGIVGLVTPR